MGLLMWLRSNSFNFAGEMWCEGMATESVLPLSWMLDFLNEFKSSTPSFPPTSSSLATLKIAVPGRWGEAPPLLWVDGLGVGVGVGSTADPRPELLA